MKAADILKVVYSFFLGLVVLGFIGIGINTFYPRPVWREYEGTPPELEAWALNTAMMLVAGATAVMAISLVRSERQAVLSNGMLLGGLFTMVYGVGMSIDAGASAARFLVIAAALAATIAVGWLKFVRAQPVRATPPPSDGHPAGEPAAEAGPGQEPEPDAGVLGRLAVVEAKLDALGRALSG